jgi:glycosyltransferase involved in cell wall biosynthesis
MKGLFIIEPELINYNGHWFNYVKSLNDLANGKNIPCEVLTTIDAESELDTYLKINRIFLKKPSKGYLKNRFFLNILFPIIYNINFYKGLNKLDKNYFKQGWVVFMGTFEHFHGFAFFLFLLKNINKIPKLKYVFFLRFSVTSNSKTQKKAFSFFWYELMFKFYKWNEKKLNFIHFVTDSTRLKSEFENSFSIKVDVLPIPHVNPIIQFNSSLLSSRKGQLTISFLGSARIEKGFETLIKAIILLSEEVIFDKLLFVVQISNNNNVSRINELVQLVKSYNFDNLILLSDNLSELEYYERLIQTDLMILAYDPKFYHSNTSGIFSECRSNGIPVIVSDETWMFDQLNKCGGLSTKYEDEVQLSGSILKVASNYEHFKKMAIAQQREWNSFHNKEVFFNTLLKLAN